MTQALPESKLPPAYPTGQAERDAWILARRSRRQEADPWHPSGFHLEEERAESGEVVSVATVFLTNRECPLRCVMCDLWKHTIPDTVPLGAIPAQIDEALATLLPAPQMDARESNHRQLPEAVRQVKLYNSGSFFDPKAIPPADYPAIAQRVKRFERVIVECHPALVGARVVQFRELMASSFLTTLGTGPRTPKLEIAMGLETAHPQVLEQLNKRMTLGQFERACRFLRQAEIAVRAFTLLQPPFLAEAEALGWSLRSLEFAFACGASVAVLIPTRAGNGALEALAARGEFSPPSLATLERALDQGLALGKGRVFADLWGLDTFSRCPHCFPARAERLRQTNLQQRSLPPVACAVCG